MQIYRDINGKRIRDIATYARKFLATHTGSKIYIGTDSQNTRKKTLYATVIAFRYDRKGVHYIYHRQSFKKIRSRFDRLWRETQFSIEVATELRDTHQLPIERIELDYNKKKTAGSNMMISAGEGYVTGLGFNVASKPDELIATKAADHIIRH